jgi:fumarate hydratase subunit alpha
MTGADGSSGRHFADAQIRALDVSVLTSAIARQLIESNYVIPADVLDALRAALGREESSLGRHALEQIVRNYELAAVDRVPVCQDSGLTVVLLEVGQDVHWVGGSVREAVFEGIREGTRAGFLRKSVIGDPTRLLRMHGDDAPGVIHVGGSPWRRRGSARRT